MKTKQIKSKKLKFLGQGLTIDAILPGHVKLIWKQKKKRERERGRENPIV